MADEAGRGGHGAFVDEDDVSHRVLVGLAKLGMALRSRAWKDAGPHGLTPTQAQILVVIANASGAAVRLSLLADELGVTAPTVSEAVAALERKKLVRKRKADDDARALAISLTSKGAAHAAEVGRWPDSLLLAADVLDDEERAVFLRALIKMIRELQERGEISPARMCATCRFFRPHAHDDPRTPHHCAFVDAPFGDGSLRLNCADHEPAGPRLGEANWLAFAGPTRAS